MIAALKRSQADQQPKTNLLHKFQSTMEKLGNSSLRFDEEWMSESARLLRDYEDALATMTERLKQGIS